MIIKISSRQLLLLFKLNNFSQERKNHYHKRLIRLWEIPLSKRCSLKKVINLNFNHIFKEEKSLLTYYSMFKVVQRTPYVTKSAKTKLNSYSEDWSLEGIEGKEMIISQTV